MEWLSLLESARLKKDAMEHNHDKGLSMKYAETTQYYLLKTALQLRPYLKKQIPIASFIPIDMDVAVAIFEI